MGLVADAALEHGARVTGVIPRFLMAYEVGHGAVSELVITESMHARKAGMYERADAFVVLPGGLGTLDETFEVLTWSQLRLSRDREEHTSELQSLMRHSYAVFCLQQKK